MVLGRALASLSLAIVAPLAAGCSSSTFEAGDGASGPTSDASADATVSRAGADGGRGSAGDEGSADPSGDDAAPSDGSSDAGLTGSSGCPAGWICPSTPIYASQIGAWFEPWWTSPDAASGYVASWPMTSEYKPVLDGSSEFYDCGNDTDITHELQAIKAAGIDYLILDDTNPFLDPDSGANTSTWLSGHINEMFNVSAHLPADAEVPLSVAIGGQLMTNTTNPLPMQALEAQFVATHFVAWTTTYFKWQGLPLLVNYNQYSTGTAHYPSWDDDAGQFTVRRAGDRVFADLSVDGGDKYTEIEAPFGTHGWWGWVQEYPQNSNTESMTVCPGADNIHRQWTYGCAAADCNQHVDRQGGQLYIQEWLRAIKTNPQTIVVSSWNEFSDETAVETATPIDDDAGHVAPSWADSYGSEVPDWYVQITTGYTSLRTGLMAGGYYQDEDNDSVYQVASGALVLQSALPHGHPVIVVPKGTLKSLLGT